MILLRLNSTSNLFWQIARLSDKQMVEGGDFGVLGAQSGLINEVIFHPDESARVTHLNNNYLK